jgi:hypothetical protein
VLPYDAKEFGRHNLGDVSRPETLAAGPQEIEIGPKGQPTMMAAAEPAPAKAAAKPVRGQKPAVATLMANRAEPDRVETTASVSEKPARIAVADADGDPASYQKLLGSLFDKEKPAPATPAVDAAVVPDAAKPAQAAGAVAPKAAAKPHPVKTAKVETKADAKLALRKGEPEAKAKP